MLKSTGDFDNSLNKNVITNSAQINCIVMHLKIYSEICFKDSVWKKYFDKFTINSVAFHNLNTCPFVK